MRDEILKYRGLLAETERLCAELDLIVSADVAAARNLLDPFLDDATKLKADQIVAVAQRIRDNVALIREYRGKIAEIKEALA